MKDVNRRLKRRGSFLAGRFNYRVYLQLERLFDDQGDHHRLVLQKLLRVGYDGIRQFGVG
jgi:hypothetical protein